MTIKISAPGKLVLAGEWAILEPGNPGMIAAVNKRVWAQVEPLAVEESKIKGIGERKSSHWQISVNIKDFGIKDLGASFDGKELKWDRELSEKEKADTQFLKGAIETTLKYLGTWKPFRITSWGEESQIVVDGQQKKVGFGSSAASVVAAVAAILKLHGNGIESHESKEIIYKLATIAHYFIQGKLGSGFDVAASTFGGVFVYKRFDSGWLVKQVESGRPINEIVYEEWPGFYVEQLAVPNDFRLLVGWTKSSASTTAMIKQMDGFKKGDPDEYKKIFDSIAGTVKRLVAAWKAANKNEVMELIKQNENILRELTEKSGVPIETPDLKKLAHAADYAGGAGKLSGAGGGDCGIGICFDQKTAAKIEQEWKKDGLWLLDTTIDKEGVK